MIELAHLSEAQKRAYILADNRLAEQAGLGSGPAGAGTGRSARHGGGPGKPRLRGGGTGCAAEGGGCRSPVRSALGLLEVSLRLTPEACRHARR